MTRDAVRALVDRLRARGVQVALDVCGMPRITGTLTARERDELRAASALIRLVLSEERAAYVRASRSQPRPVPAEADDEALAHTLQQEVGTTRRDEATAECAAPVAEEKQEEADEDLPPYLRPETRAAEREARARRRTEEMLAGIGRATRDDAMRDHVRDARARVVPGVAPCGRDSGRSTDGPWRPPPPTWRTR